MVTLPTIYPGEVYLQDEKSHCRMEGEVELPRWPPSLNGPSPRKVDTARSGPAPSARLFFNVIADELDRETDSAFIDEPDHNGGFGPSPGKFPARWASCAHCQAVCHETPSFGAYCLTCSSSKMRSSTSGTLQVSPAVFAHPKWKKEAKKRHMGHSILVGVPHIGFKEEV